MRGAVLVIHSEQKPVPGWFHAKVSKGDISAHPHNEARIFQHVLIPGYMDRDGQWELVKQICKIDLELNVRMC